MRCEQSAMSNLPAVCIDASIVADRILQRRDVRLGQYWHEWKTARRALIAPSLLYYEVTNVFYQKLKKGEITDSEVRKALSLVAGLSIKLYEETGLHEKAVQIAHESGLAATYDAHYLALAWQEGAEFYTRDARFARAVQGSFGFVRLIEQS